MLKKTGCVLTLAAGIIASRVASARSAAMATLVVLLLGATVQSASASPVWTAVGTIAYVQVIEDGEFLVYTSAPLSAPCTQAHAIYIYLNENGVTTDGVKALLAVALTAITAGKNVLILYDDSTPACYGKYIQISP
jgi:hypothetical protein